MPVLICPMVQRLSLVKHTTAAGTSTQARAYLAGATAALSQDVAYGISNSRMAKQGVRALLASAGQGERDADVQVTGAVPFDSFPLRSAPPLRLSVPKFLPTY